MKSSSYLSDFELIVLLVLLRLGDDAYGVPIAREMQEQTRREAKLGSVYAALERLEEKGFVVSELGEPTKERGEGQNATSASQSEGCARSVRLDTYYLGCGRASPSWKECIHDNAKFPRTTSLGHLAVGALLARWE